MNIDVDRGAYCGAISMNIALALVREVTRLPPHHEGGRHALLYQDSSLGPSTEAFGGSQVGAGRWLNRLDGLATDPIASKLHDLSSALPEQVKQIIQQNLGTQGEVILTSSGAEAINHALKGMAFRNRGGRILISPRVPLPLRNAALWLSRQGWQVANIGSEGDADIIAVELVDHETGGIRDIAALRHEYPNSTLIVEATAAVGRIPISNEGIDVLTMGFDYFGALVTSKGVRIDPLIHGGGEQGGRRGGHLPSILFSEDIFSLEGIEELDTVLLEAINEHEFIINSDRKRVPGILNIQLPRVSAEAVLVDLANEGVYMSSSSGCTASTGMPSRILTSMGLSEDEALSSIRISIRNDNEEQEIRHGIEILAKIVKGFQS
ncbi:MAG: hypothetical protein CMB49_02675 [Euryarchaeota archaeon]|nr:hypothetical protein [Euryarchaeota archaeon]